MHDSWKNGNTKPDIYDLLDTLTPDMKELLLEYLVADIRVAKLLLQRHIWKSSGKRLKGCSKNLIMSLFPADYFISYCGNNLRVRISFRVVTTKENKHIAFFFCLR